MIRLDVLRARHGDCLLLQASDDSRTARVLIDGGPSRTFRESLRPRLESLSRAAFGGEPAHIDLAMISHIDNDHIGGMLKLLQHNKDHHPNPPLCEIGQLWHNSFYHLGGQDLNGDAVDPQTAVMTASRASQWLARADISGASDTGVVLAGVAAGNAVSELAERFNLETMHDFPDGLVVGGRQIDSFAPLRLYVLGPGQDQIEDLRKTWQDYMDELQRQSAAVQATALQLDRSVANISSIVVIAQCAGERLLLTGDARGDYVLDTLEAQGWMEQDRCEVALFKWPHHGSIRNLPAGIFRRIIARHHVVSADGRHSNPDIESIERFVAEHDPAQSTTIHLTYSPDELTKPAYREHFKLLFGRLNEARASGHDITINTPAASSPWLTIELPNR